MDRHEKLSLLIIDDQIEVLDIYRRILHEQFGHLVDCCSHPGEAIRLVRDRLFDVVVVDAKIPYKGAGFGGLILADEVARHLGPNSVLLMSQYDVRRQVAGFNPSFSFISKPPAGEPMVRWVERDLLVKLRGLLDKQFGFVVMPFRSEVADQWYRELLVPAMLGVGYRVRRMDEIPTTKAINVEMLNRIRDAQFVVVFVDGHNPNVYFEAGFASALEKFLVLFAATDGDLPFDIRANHLFRVNREETSSLRRKVVVFMEGLRGSRV